MSTRQAEVLTAKRSPQIALMQQILARVSNPFKRAFQDIQVNRVRKAGTAEEGRTMYDKVTQILVNELKRATETEETDALPVVTKIEDMPNEGACFLVNVSGSVVNLAAGIDNINLTLAYVKDGEVLSTVILFPAKDNLYIVEKGCGADGPNLKLRVPAKEDIDNLVVGFFSPVSATENEDEVMATFTKLRKLGCHVRISGNTISDVIDACAGQYDAYVGYNLSAIDVMIAELIVRESGGYTCETDGSKVETGSTSLVIANHKLQGKLLKELAS